MAQHNDFGKWGEEVATAYLEEQGFTILERNFRYGHIEVDIIAQRNDVLYFVEVKTRHGETYKAEWAVNAKKRALLWRAMMMWKRQHPSPMPVRFPVIAVVVTDHRQPPIIRFHEDIWELD